VGSRGVVSMSKNNNEKKIYIRPEDIIRLTLANLQKWKTKDKIEDNLKKMLWYFEDERYNKLAEEFDL